MVVFVWEGVNSESNTKSLGLIQINQMQESDSQGLIVGKHQLMQVNWKIDEQGLLGHCFFSCLLLSGFIKIQRHHR